MTLTQIFAKVLNMSLTASLVIVLVIAARFVLRKSPKVFSYALWAVVLFRLLCPVSLPSPVSLLGLLDAPVAQTEGITTMVEYIPYRVVETAAENPQPDHLPQNTVTQAPTQSQQTKVEPRREPLSAAEIMTYIWLAGIAVMVIVGVGSYLRFRKHLTGAMQVKDNIYLVDHIDSAFVAGLIRPKVYLPSDIPLKQMGYIIAHEQYHIRRLDHVTKHLSFAALCIHWFNPFVWVAFILSGKDLEMSCDEAVIKRLGEGIRADYSASLLSLATGRRIIAGTPLAFGEGDTKGRIKNMAKWKQPKKWVSIVSFILCFTILTACAANPEQNVVISKNDGSFDVNVVQSATQPADQVEITTQNVSYTDSFTSTDGSVQFQLSIDDTIPVQAWPVVEIVPHYLTAEDAERVANALFGDAEFYEQRPRLAPYDELFSKSEIQEWLADCQRWLDMDYMTQLYGDVQIAESEIETVKAFIENYSEVLDAAPEEDVRVPCEWTLKTDSVYLYPQEELSEVDTSEDNMGIEAEVVMDGINYQYSISTRDRDDFKINNIHAGISSGYGPSTIERDELISKFCRTDEPTEAQMTAVKEKAKDMISRMELGDWLVDQCYVQKHTYRGTPEYYVCVTAVPTFQGAASIRRQQIGNLRSSAAYASSYYLTDMEFRFSPNGELIDFELSSTIDTKQVINDNTAVLTMDDLMERAKQHLSLSDSGAYYNPASFVEMLEEEYGENIICMINITQMDYGLTRVKAPNTDDSYYYVPALMLRGSIEYCGQNTGTVYDSYSQMRGNDELCPLVCLNAIDGSVIQLQNPD